MKHPKQGSAASRLNVGGVPCEVVYRGPETEAAVVRPVPLRPDLSGSFQWDPAVAGPNEAQPAGRNERALTRRETASPQIIQLEATEAHGELAPTQGDLQKLHQILRGRYILATLLARCQCWEPPASGWDSVSDIRATKARAW